jgi:hypothetical protein
MVPTSIIRWFLLLGLGDTTDLAKSINFRPVYDITVAILLL